MSTDFIQQQIDALLKEASEALRRSDWLAVRERAEDVLAFDPQNASAEALLGAANRRLPQGTAAPEAVSTSAQPASSTSPTEPATFANGRYVVRRFLGEGGRKKVYLAHDAALDRDVAFALIKTRGP